MGLRKNDLIDTVYKIFEVDSFSSKMGEDQDIVTVSFSLNEKAPAEDLVKFLEGGYSFILDADVTPGEQSDGTYKVFVEIQRDKKIAENVYELLDGVKKISGLEQLKFRYYKNFKSKDATLEALAETIPTNPEDYGIKKSKVRLENYKEFFNKSYLEDVSLFEDELTIKKKYADQLKFKFLDFGDNTEVMEKIEEPFNINAFPEILFLTKYLGDYNIAKYGDKIIVTNQDKSLVMHRQ